jgi:hypothetical protein
MKLLTDKSSFKPEGLHKKHLETQEPSQHLLLDTGKPRKTCVERKTCVVRDSSVTCLISSCEIKINFPRKMSLATLKPKIKLKYI